MSPTTTASVGDRNAKYQAIQHAGDASISAVPALSKQAVNASKIIEGGISGAGGVKLANISSFINQGARLVGAGGELPGTADSLAAIADKLGVSKGFNDARSAGQNSYAAFESATRNLSPDISQPPEAMSAIMALNLVQNQYNRDFAKFAKTWSDTHPTDNLSNIGLQFSQVHSPEEYTQLESGLQDAMMRKGLMGHLAQPPMGADPAKYYAQIEASLAKKRDAHGNPMYPPGMTRVFHQ